MRRLVMFNRVSAEGSFAVPDGKLDWVVPDDQIDQEGASATPDADTVLFGRKTYQMFASFWPHVLDDGAAARNPHGPGRSPAMQAMAVMLNDATKVVFSKTLTETPWQNSRVVREFDPAVVRTLKEASGKTIMIFGSGSIVSLLTEHDLIDDYTFIVSPVFVGNGRPVITGVSNRVKLTLAEARAYPSGNVKLQYLRTT